MAKRSPRIPELREKKTDLSCMCRLFSILESCQHRSSRKQISNGRPADKDIIDYPRKIDQIASFDEECRKIQNEVDLARRNLIREDMPIEKHKTRQNIVKRQQYAKMDSELIDRLMKTHKPARKTNNAASLINRMPSTSAEISLNKLTLAAILEAVCAQNHQEDSMVSECVKRTTHLEMYDEVDEINMQQVQMSAKAFVDQMFIDRKLICNERTTSESKSFSEALEVLNLNQDLFMDLLPDRHSDASQIEKGTVKSDLAAKFSGCDILDATSSERNGKMNKGLWKKVDYQCQYSRRTSFMGQPSDKIVILKPAPSNAKHSENVTCHSSSMQFQKKLSRRVLDAKAAYFCFTERKKKLKHTFGGTRKERRSNDRSTVRVGDDCICCGVDIMNSYNSSTNAKTKEKVCKRQGLKSNRGSDIACPTDTARKKLDFSSVGISKRHEFDVILEAKKHLSARLKNLNAIETVASKKSPRTLGRILSSPEHDFWPFSPRRDSQYCPDSAHTRFIPYNTSPRVSGSSSPIANGGQRAACLSPLRSNTEAKSCDDNNKYDETLQMTDRKISSLIRSNVEKACDAGISAMDDISSNGESKIEEVTSLLPPELHFSEVPTEIDSTSTNELHEDDENDLLPENEVFTSTMDDFPSTPLSIKHQEEHRSPVSVLEPFFIEDANSPPSFTLQTARQRLQPLRLDFDEQSFEQHPKKPPFSANSCIEEENHLSQYVHLVLEASCLNWDHLSKIGFLSPEELIDDSLFDEVEFLPTDCYFDPKLLFDHIKEILLEIHQSHFCSPPWLAFSKPKRITSVPLAEVVVDEIMTEAFFYRLPRTEKRTLDQLVSKDVADCRSWLDVRNDTEQIVIDVSEDILEESILDILLQFHS